MSGSDDDGLTWTPPTAVNTDASVDNTSHGDTRADVETDGQGNWVVVWDRATVGADIDVFVARSGNPGAAWTDPTSLTGGRGITPQACCQFPDMETDGLGSWVTVWQSNDTRGGTIGTDWDILYTNCSPLDSNCDGLPESGPGAPTPTPIPSPGPPLAVGGIVGLVEAGNGPESAAHGGGNDYTRYIAALTAGAVLVGASGWYARRCWMR